VANTPQPGDADDAENRPQIPFLGGFDLSQLMGMLRTEGPVNWSVARQVATWVALQGRPEPSIDDSDRAELAELVRAAQTNVAGSTTLPATVQGSVRLVGPSAWAHMHLDALRSVAEALAGALNDAIQRDLANLDPEDTVGLLGDAGFGNLPLGAEQLGAVLPLLAPTLLGVQAGSMVGYLAQHALGRYDLPLPTNDPPTVCFVGSNIDRFEAEWSLARDDLRFYLAVREVIHAAQRSVSGVQEQLVDLARAYVSGYEIDSSVFEERFGAIDPSDPDALRSITQDPGALLGAMRTPRQEAVLEQLQSFTSVIEGYTDTTLARIGKPLMGSFDQIHEAVARHRLERGEAGRFIEGLLGLQLDREHYERGAAFCEGVLERAGPSGLDRLWERDDRFPTAAELDAPGL
jgi:putative hydrolase